MNLNTKYKKDWLMNGTKYEKWNGIERNFWEWGQKQPSLVAEGLSAYMTVMGECHILELLSTGNKTQSVEYVIENVNDEYRKTDEAKGMKRSTSSSWVAGRSEYNWNWV